MKKIKEVKQKSVFLNLIKKVIHAFFINNHTHCPFLVCKNKVHNNENYNCIASRNIQTMIWKRIYANRTQWFSYFLILFGTIIPYMLYLDKDIPSGCMATIILIALFLWIELLQYQRKLLFFTFGVSIACLLLYYKGFPTKMCEIFPLLVYCIEIFPLMLQAKKEK